MVFNFFVVFKGFLVDFFMFFRYKIVLFVNNNKLDFFFLVVILIMFFFYLIVLLSFVRKCLKIVVMLGIIDFNSSDLVFNI